MAEDTAIEMRNVNKWFGKLDTDFSSFLAYFSPADVRAPARAPPPPPPAVEGADSS